MCAYQSRHCVKTKTKLHAGIYGVVDSSWNINKKVWIYSEIYAYKKEVNIAFGRILIIDIIWCLLCMVHLFGHILHFSNFLSAANSFITWADGWPGLYMPSDQVE